jgi:tRNA A37 N6-isopentenylltransferase MiaA
MMENSKMKNLNILLLQKSEMINEKIKKRTNEMISEMINEKINEIKNLDQLLYCHLSILKIRSDP